MDRADPQRIRITLPDHPLHGQEFPVVREQLADGVPHVLIRLPSGLTQIIPTRWTTAPAPRPLVLTPQRLRRLLTLVAYLRPPRPLEVTYESAHPARALVHAAASDPPAAPDPVE